MDLGAEQVVMSAAESSIPVSEYYPDQTLLLETDYGEINVGTVEIADISKGTLLITVDGILIEKTFDYLFNIENVCVFANTLSIFLKKRTSDTYVQCDIELSTKSYYRDFEFEYNSFGGKICSINWVAGRYYVATTNGLFIFDDEFNFIEKRYDNSVVLCYSNDPIINNGNGLAVYVTDNGFYVNEDFYETKESLIPSIVFGQAFGIPFVISGSINYDTMTFENLTLRISVGQCASLGFLSEYNAPICHVVLTLNGASFSWIPVVPLTDSNSSSSNTFSHNYKSSFSMSGNAAYNKYMKFISPSQGTILLNGISRTGYMDNLTLQVSSDDFISPLYPQIYINGIRTPFRKYNPDNGVWERLDNFFGEE